MLFPAFQQVEHSFHQIVNIQQFQLGAAIIHGKRLIVGHRPAEGADSAVVFGAAVTHQIGEAIYRHLGTGFPGIVKKQFFARLLAAAVFAVAKAPGQCGLNGGGQHDGGLIVVLFQAIQQLRGKAEIALHKIFRAFGAVHARQIEHKISFLAVFVQFSRGGIQIILENFFDLQIRAGFVFPVPDIFQVVHQCGAHHAFGTRYKNIHWQQLHQSLEIPFNAFCTYSVVRIFFTVPSTSKRVVLWLV